MSQNVWATIMPFGPVTNFLLAQNFFSGQLKLALISGTAEALKILDHLSENTKVCGT